MHATEMLKDIPLFKGLPEETLNELEARTTVKRFEDGEVYLNAGQAPKAFCVVLSGEFKFYRVNKAGKEQVFGYAQVPMMCSVSPALTDPYKSVPGETAWRERSTSKSLEDRPCRQSVRVMHREPQLAVAILQASRARRYSDDARPG